MSKPLRRLLILAGVAVVAAGVGILTAYISRLNAPSQTGQTLYLDAANPRGTAMPAFRLDTANGSFGYADLKKHWTFMFFGYTHCPDVCPLALGRLAVVMGDLEKAQRAKDLQVVFVSVDPQRDTPEKLSTYAHYFNPRFIGATSDIAAIKKLTGQLGIYFKREPDPYDSENYLVQHSASILVVAPNGRLVARLEPPNYPKLIESQLREIQKQYGM
jgi:protein SCO1/2